jgi:predicted nucleic acid-binding protein
MIAQRILAVENFATSGQVLAEFYNNVVKKGRQPLTNLEALSWVRQLARKPCQAIDAALVEAGIAMSMRYQISYWDGAILAAAHRLGATRVYTE